MAYTVFVDANVLYDAAARDYVLLATARSSLRPQRELALENLALRQQLAILHRKSKRPELNIESWPGRRGRALLEELLRKRATRQVDRLVDRVEQRPEPCEAGGQMKLRELDDHPVGNRCINVAHGTGTSGFGVDLRTSVTEAGQCAIEVGRLKAEVRDPESGTKCAFARLGRHPGFHARGELTDHQQLPTEKHAMVPAFLS